MIINSSFLLPLLLEKMRRGARDASRHIICPTCKVRTHLYKLADGRRKCASCSEKFFVERESDTRRVERLADILVCFCLDFPAQKTAELTGYRYHFVLSVYQSVRAMLAERTATRAQLRLALDVDRPPHDFREAFCQKCHKSGQCPGWQQGDAPIFGIRMLENKHVQIEPIGHGKVYQWQPHGKLPLYQPLPCCAEYAAFICKGEMHRFTDRTKHVHASELESFWSWVEGRLVGYHGIQHENYYLYLKELEWKFNSRLLSSEDRAIQLAEMLPESFMKSYLHRRAEIYVVSALRGAADPSPARSKYEKGSV